MTSPLLTYCFFVIHLQTNSVFTFSFTRDLIKRITIPQQNYEKFKVTKDYNPRVHFSDLQQHDCTYILDCIYTLIYMAEKILLYSIHTMCKGRHTDIRQDGWQCS